MTILVTGSSGHLGEALMRRLRPGTEPVRGIDIKPGPWTDSAGSVADRDFVRQSMRGVRTVLHAATLHKPHVATHSRQDFVDTNITGTLILLEEAMAAGVESFIFTSTTSTFGSAMNPAPDAPAAWIDETVAPIPRNVYGVTKLAAEQFCELFHRAHGLPVLILRTSRFFPEADDDPEMRNAFDIPNAQANELLYRRADIADVVGAHLAALDRARAIGFGRYIVSATTPFTRGDLATLRRDAPSVVHRLFPRSTGLYQARNWRMFPGIDRVYDNRRAREELGWEPKYGFAAMLDALAEGREFRSELALAIGAKGYHGEIFAEGPYPVN